MIITNLRENVFLKLKVFGLEEWLNQDLYRCVFHYHNNATWKKNNPENLQKFGTKIYQRNSPHHLLSI